MSSDGVSRAGLAATLVALSILATSPEERFRAALALAIACLGVWVILWEPLGNLYYRSPRLPRGWAFDRYDRRTDPSGSQTFVVDFKLTRDSPTGPGLLVLLCNRVVMKSAVRFNSRQHAPSCRHDGRVEFKINEEVPIVDLDGRLHSDGDLRIKKVTYSERRGSDE